jgi:hypothetical protein
LRIVPVAKFAGHRIDATEVQQVASLHLAVPALFLALTGVFEGAGQ